MSRGDIESEDLMDEDVDDGAGMTGDATGETGGGMKGSSRKSSPRPTGTRSCVNCEIGCWIAEIVRQIAFRRRPEIARWQFSQKDVRPFPRWRAQGVQQRRFAEIVGWQRAEQEIVGRPFAQRRQQEAVSLVNVRGRIHLRLRRDYILLRLICIRSEPAARPHHGRYRGVCPVSDVEALSTLVTGLDGDLRCDPVATRQLECLARRAHDSSAHEDGR